jgi:rhodanese-related sulfurtransferase
MGLQNVYGLKNGTSGWLLAGYQLETGADRLTLAPPSPEGVAAAEAYAARLAQEDGVRYLNTAALQAMMARREQETVYLIDVRTQEEYTAGHIPGFRWFPGGQAVQRSDDVAVVHHCPIVFACDRMARATLTASWYRQMGFDEVYAVEGGTAAWAARGLSLEKGLAEPSPFGLDTARSQVSLLSPQTLQASKPPVVIFVDTSQDFARGHVPGAHWVPRGWLELRIAEVAPARETPVAVTCLDGRSATLAGATLKELGYQSVAVLDDGMAAWQRAGLPVEKGLAGVMAPPNDVVLSGPDRNFADMMNYLRWEEALGYKYAPMAH